MENKEEKNTERKDYKKKSFKDDRKGKSTVKKKFKKTTGKGKFEKKPAKYEKPEPIRLNKYIAASGICSRRDADELIKKGKIKVNGKLVTELGVKVELSDKVFINDKQISPEKKVYILINKPKDYKIIDFELLFGDLYRTVK